MSWGTVREVCRNASLTGIGWHFFNPSTSGSNWYVLQSWVLHNQLELDHGTIVEEVNLSNAQISWRTPTIVVSCPRFTWGENQYYLLFIAKSYQLSRHNCTATLSQNTFGSEYYVYKAAQAISWPLSLFSVWKIDQKRQKFRTTRASSKGWIPDRVMCLNKKHD